MENLWNLKRYPTKLCDEEEKNEVWREVKTKLQTPVRKIKVFLTARTILKANLDLGRYPLTESDVNGENRWMTLIRFESGSRFNIVVLKTRDDQIRVKAIDFVLNGEPLWFKYEVEQPPVKFNLKHLVRQLDSMNFQRCSKINCTCYNYKHTENNYFLLEKEEIHRVRKPPSTTLKTWKRKLEINFHHAENHKNAIFNRISLNPFTINLRHKLWDKIEENINLPLKRRRQQIENSLNSENQSSNQSICSDCYDKYNLRTTSRLIPSTSSDRKCDLCSSMSGLTTHRRMKHGRRKELIKDEWEISGIYVRKSSLRTFRGDNLLEGMKVNVKEKLDRKLLKTTVIIEKLRLFPCDKCDKEFLRKQHLKHHEKYCLKVVEDDVDKENITEETIGSVADTSPLSCTEHKKLPNEIHENTKLTPVVLEDDTATIYQCLNQDYEISTSWTNLQQSLKIKNTSPVPVQLQENTISSVGRHQENSVKSSGSNKEETHVVTFESLDQKDSSPFELDETAISTIFEIVY